MEFLENQINTYPDLKDQYDELRTLYNRKFWHQLGEVALKFANERSFWRGQNVVDMYINLLKTVETKMNQLTLVKIIIQGAKQLSIDQAEEFLSTLLTKKSQFGESAFFVLRMSLLKVKVMKEQFVEAKKDIKLMVKELNDMKEPANIVFFSYYEVACMYYKSQGPPSKFYKNALKMIAYMPSNAFDEEETKDLAKNLAVSAMVSEHVFNFGEVAITPMMKILEGGENEWLLRLIQALAVGDIVSFGTIVSKHQEQFDAETALVSFQDKLKEKLALLAVIDLVFNKDPHERVVSFEEISARISLPLDEVEFVLMRMFSLGLMEGKIDQISQNVDITALQPRVLNNEQIRDLADRVNKWSVKVRDAMINLENESEAIFA